MAQTRPFALLINPPVYDFALYDLYLKPYGLLRVEAWLRDGGWDTVFVNALDYEDAASSAVLGTPVRKADGTGKFFRQTVPAPALLKNETRRFARYGITREAFRARLAAASGGRCPDAVFVTSGMTYWYGGAAEAARECREMFPGAPVLVGGVYASLLPEHCGRTTGADAVIAGGRGADLAAALSRLRLPAPPGEYPAFPPASSPAWKHAGVLRLNAGCPFACDYCASRLFFPRFEAGSARAAFDAFRSFMEAGIRNFAFYDDALLADKERVFLPFLEETLDFREKLPPEDRPKFFLPNAVHIQSLDGKTAGLMRRAGFQEIRMGFESSSAGFHEEHTPLTAKFRPEEFPASIRTLREAGFPDSSLSVYILAGLPGQRASEAEDSVKSAAACKARVRLAEFSPVPGSALWEKSVRLCRYPLEEEPLFHNNSFFPMEWEGFTRQDMERLKRIVKEENAKIQPQ